MVGPAHHDGMLVVHLLLKNKYTIVHQSLDLYLSYHTIFCGHTLQRCTLHMHIQEDINAMPVWIQVIACSRSMLQGDAPPMVLSGSLVKSTASNPSPSCRCTFFGLGFRGSPWRMLATAGWHAVQLPLSTFFGIWNNHEPWSLRITMVLTVAWTMVEIDLIRCSKM